MSDIRDSSRNPLVIPTDKPAGRRGCPACGAADWDAFSSDGIATFKCRKCKNVWQGGIGQVPYDPRVPIPPINPKDQPATEFVRTKTSDKPQEVRIRPVDTTQPFRKGALIPDEENDV